LAVVSGPFLNVARLERHSGARALVGEDPGPGRGNRYTVELLESSGQHFILLLRGPIARHGTVCCRYDELARSRCGYPARVSRVMWLKEKARALAFLPRTQRVGKGSIGYKYQAVRVNSKAQRPVEPVGHQVPRPAACQDLRYIARYIRNKQPIAHERHVVQTRTEIGEHRPIAGSRIDSQHLAAVHLGGDDIALRIELDGVRDAEIASYFFRRSSL